MLEDGSDMSASQAEALVVPSSSQVLVEATPCSELSNTDEESIPQISLICALMFTQTQEKVAPPASAEPIMSRSESATGSSAMVTKVLAREMADDSLLQADTQYFAGNSGDQDEGDSASTSVRHSPRRLPLGRPLAPVQVLPPNDLPAATEKPRAVAGTCFGRQRDNAPPVCNHLPTSDGSQKENDPSSCDSVAPPGNGSDESSAQAQQLLPRHCTAKQGVSPIPRRGHATTPTDGTSAPSVLALLSKDAPESTTPRRDSYNSQDQGPQLATTTPISAPSTPLLVKTAKSAPGRTQPRLRPLGRSNNANTPPRPALGESTGRTPTLGSGRRERPHPLQLATNQPQDFNLVATQLEEHQPVELSRPRLQSPPELDSEMRGQARGQPGPSGAPRTPTTTHTRNPGTSRTGGQKSPRQRGAPTTPTTALRPAGTTRPATPSQDSFTRLTAAEEKERWLRSVDAEMLDVSVGRLAGLGGFETDNDTAGAPVNRLQSRVPRTPSPRRRDLTTTSPVQAGKSSRAQKQQQGQTTPMQRGRPNSRHALKERNNGEGDDAQMAGPSSRPLSSRGQHQRSKGKGPEGDPADEDLPSQLSNMSVSSPPPPHSRPRRRDSQHLRRQQDPEAENVLVPHTPTNSSGSTSGLLGHQPSRPPPRSRQGVLDLDAPIPLTDSQKSREDHSSSSSSNPVPPAGQPQPQLRMRTPSPISYVTHSSGEHPLAPAEPAPATRPGPYGPLLPSTPPNQGPSSDGGLQITPTQPSEIQDSQHPAIVAARARFTDVSESERASAAAASEAAEYRPQPRRGLPPPSEFNRERLNRPPMARKLDFGPVHRGPEAAGPSVRAPPPLAPAAVINRPTKPTAQLRQRPANPKIFPPVRGQKPNSRGPRTEDQMEVDEGNVTRDDPIETSSPPLRPSPGGNRKPDSKGKGKETAVDAPARPLAPLGHPKQPAKRGFQEIEDGAEEPELPSEIDFAMETQEAQALARKKREEQGSSPVRPAPAAKSSPRQYTSKAKQERDSAKKRRKLEQQQQEGAGALEDEAEMEVDQGDEAGPSSPTKPPAKRPRSSSGTKSSRPASESPAKRQAKKRKTASLRRTFQVPTSRVFARWAQNKYYYPGTVTARSPKNHARLTIQFDDASSSNVNISQVRLGALQFGDVVHTTDRRRVSGIVRDVSGWTHEGGWSVEVALQDKDGDEEQLLCTGKNIMVHEKDIERQWADRIPDSDEIEVGDIESTGDNAIAEPEASPEPEVPARPTKRRSSVRAQTVVPRSATRRPSSLSGAVKGNNLFSNIAFVITMHPTTAKEVAKDDRKDRDKDRLQLDISQGGGMVFENWDQLYSIKGKDNISGRRDVRWVGPKRGIKNVLLLADQPTKTAKYLMALALGVPCVSSAWIRDSVTGVESSWRSYLLAAGRSDYLGTDVSQLFDQAWSTDEQLLHDPFRSTIVRRPWLDLHVLCVFPTGKRKSTQSGDPQANQRYPQMMCAMGAASVEVVTVSQNASRPVTDYDYIILSDGHTKHLRDELETASPGKVGSISWFKQCLITGLALDPA